MCLLSYKPADKKWDVEHLKQGLLQNRDGWGLIGIFGEELQYSKGFEAEELKEMLGHFQGVPAVFHARWATHGTKTINQVHPYKVINDIYMAHNGIFNLNITDDTKSDTWHMARLLEALGYEELLSLIENETWKTEYAKAIGTNKVAFINPTLGVTLINEHLGHWVDGVWMSNNSYKPYQWDKGGKTVSSGSIAIPVLEADELLESWLASESPARLIEADLAFNNVAAIDALEYLIRDYTILYNEQFEYALGE